MYRNAREKRKRQCHETTFQILFGNVVERNGNKQVGLTR